MLVKRKIKKSQKDEIEPEEILIDSKKEEREIATGLGEGEFQLPLSTKIITSLFFFIILVLLILFGKTFYLAILKHDIYEALSRENSIKIFPIKAPRGIIYDKNGIKLVENIPKFDIFLDLRIIKEKQISDSDIEVLSQITGRSNSELKKFIQEKISQNQSSFLIAEGQDPEAIKVLESRTYPASAIRLESTFLRNYLSSSPLSHVLGYIGYVTQEDISLNPEFYLRDFIGKTGIEFYFDDFLRGENGEDHFYVDVLGDFKKSVRGKEPTAGIDLYLNIDFELQEKIYETIAQTLKRNGLKKAAAVAISPKNGKVLALLSFPEYDANIFTPLEKYHTGSFLTGFTTPDLQEEILKILEDPNQPLFNRALSGEYPSGSTIKPFIASAALEENIINPRKYIYDPGFISLPNIYNPNIIYTFRDWKAHGSVNMIKAIAESCNVYFYHIGGGFGDIKGLGIENIGKYLKLFGLGSILGIDLPGEAPGLIPAPDWKVKTRGEEWYIGDTYNVSIGQGDIRVTPLQMAVATSVLANNGTLYKPQIVKAIKDKDGNLIKDFELEVIRKDFILAKNIDIVRQGMREAVVSGSSRNLAALLVKVAGKTGTAEAPQKDKKPHAWWTGFGPFEDPEIVLTILVENGGEGSAIAVPIAKEVLQWYFNR